MSWTKIDDQLHAHHKISRAWRCRPALGLHLMAMSYSACFALDGFVPDAFVIEKLPRAKERATTTAALVDSGLWEPESEGWRIHNWAAYNGREVSPALRAARSAAGKKGAAAKWSHKQTMAIANGKPMAIANGNDGNGCHPPSPYQSPKTPPSPPLGGEMAIAMPIGEAAPVRPRGARGRELEAWRSQLVAWGIEHFPDALPGAVAGAVSWLSVRSDAAVLVGDLRSLAAANEMWADQLGQPQEVSS